MNAKQETEVSIAKLNTFPVGQTLDNQSLIHSYIPTAAKKTSVIMIPGLGLGANIYESTPDGRNGWVYHFLKADYPVYTVDTSDLASAGLSQAEAKASLTKWDAQSIWSRWGLGASPNQPYPEGQFPTKSFTEFYSSIPMRINKVQTNSQTDQSRDKKTNKSKRKRKKGGQLGANPQEVKNIIRLLERTGPSILLVHSMSGTIGYQVARQRPDLVKALVAIEPVGSPTKEQEIKEQFADIPYLGVYGDYLKSRNQTGRLEAVQTTVDLIQKNGGQAEVLRLPEEGIKGNSHLMMLDKNNRQISTLIINWLVKNLKTS